MVNPAREEEEKSGLLLGSNNYVVDLTAENINAFHSGINSNCIEEPIPSESDENESPSAVDLRATRD